MLESRPMQYTVTITELPESMVEITGELSWESFATFEKKAFDRLAAHLELDGFRKGHIPEQVAKQHIKDELVLGDMAELAVQSLYPTILVDKKIDALGRPQLAITKLARDNSLGFTIRTAVLPVIKLPNYKKIAKEVGSLEEVVVTDADINKVVEDLRQLRAYGHIHSETDNHEHTEQLPEVNDEFAKSFGNFETVETMREKIKENLTNEKIQAAKDKRRITIMEAIIGATDIVVPQVVLRSEQEKMLAQIEADIMRAGMTLEQYLTQAGKDKEALMDEFKPEAEKRAKFQLAINAIARDAEVVVSDTEVEAEADRLIAMYPGADRARTIAYADLVLTNEKVFTLLES